MADRLSTLPLFATDQELALAIVGKERAAMWIKTVLPQLERKGFPKLDALHDGRPIPLVRRYYDRYMLLTDSPVSATGEEDCEDDHVLVAQRRPEMRPLLNLDARTQTVLRYMIAHPEALTHRDIRSVGELTLQRVAEYGVIEPDGRDVRGDQIWRVTNAGRDEIERIDYWHRGAE